MLCSAINAQGKEEEEGTFLVMVLSSNVCIVCADTWLPQKWLDTCPLMGSDEEIPGVVFIFYFYFLFACVQFLLHLLKLLLSQSTSLLTFPLFSSSPVGEESEQEALWVFGWGQPETILR